MLQHRSKVNYTEVKKPRQHYFNSAKHYFRLESNQCMIDGSGTQFFDNGIKHGTTVESLLRKFSAHTVLNTFFVFQVERVTYKSMTVSIARGCTNECWHGCYASGFGLTKLKCTSCCPTSGCNTGNFASQTHPSCWIVLSLMFTSACITSGIVFQ